MASTNPQAQRADDRHFKISFKCFFYVMSVVVTARIALYLSLEKFQISLLLFPKQVYIEALILSCCVNLLRAAFYLIVKYFVRFTQRKSMAGTAKRNVCVKINNLDPDHLSIIQRIFLYVEQIVFFTFGYLRVALCYFGIEKRILAETQREGFVPLYDSNERFYVKYVFPRASLVLNNTICGPPGPEVDIMERMSPDCGWTLKFTGRVKTEVNLASYNYLGFAESDGPCTLAVSADVDTYGVANCGPRSELGTPQLVKDLEELTARFLGLDACMVFGMGFATNTANIPALVGKESLILSDELNHASIIMGCRLSGATCKTFKHADMDDLEEKLVYNIVYGQPKSHKVWRKILIVVEGIYSMEGTIVNLPKIIELKKKYRAYLYLDEAHSIGALGSRGRGVVDHFGCDPKDVDIMMGTFTKSFGAAGGYIAGSKMMINALHLGSHTHTYGACMPPPVASQIITSMKIIMGEDGSNDGINRMRNLATNTHYFRTKLREMGFSLVGDDESPLVVVMLYSSTKIAIHTAFQNKGVALVAVGFPVTPLGKTRIRMCISAAHTKEMLDKALRVFDELGDWMNIKFFKGRNT